MRVQMIILLYLFLIVLVPESPSVYKVIVDALAVGVCLASLFWLNRFMNQAMNLEIGRYALYKLFP